MTISAKQRQLGVIGLLAVGGMVRLLLAWHYPGDSYDLGSMLIMRAAVVHHGLHAYAVANTATQTRWPYPPGWAPVMVAAVSIGHALSISATTALRIPLIAADLGLVWLVQAILGWTGQSELKRLGGAALVAFGPLFIAIVSLHGQMDSVSALAVVGAIALWMRADPERRWLYAGLAIGIGAAIKTTPIFAIFALLPTATGGKERIKLLAAAAAVPALAVLPFAAAYPQTVHDILSYHGAPGVGGINLLVQPRLALDWYGTGNVALSGLSEHLYRLGGDLGLVAAVAAAAYCWRRRLEPLTAAMLIYAAVLIFGVNLFLQYGLWLLPLVIARGRLRTAAAASATLCVPLVFRYAGELGWRSTVWSTNAVLGLYVPVMDLLLFATVAGVVITVTEIERSRAVVRAPRRAVPSYRLLGGLATAAAVVATVGTVAVAAGGHGSGPPSTVAVQGAGPAVMLGAPSGGVAGATVPASTAPNRPGARRSPSVSASPASTPAATHHRAGSTTTAPPSCASTCTSSSAPAGSKPHLAAPTLARVAPAVGLVSGGTRVVLYGTGFTRDATVRFGMLTLPNVTWVSSKELAVDAPPAAQVRSATDLAGAVHGLVVQIVVSTAAGHSATGALAAFTYL